MNKCTANKYIYMTIIYISVIIRLEQKTDPCELYNVKNYSKWFHVVCLIQKINSSPYIKLIHWGQFFVGHPV